ncbi:MAG: thioredoxin-disulfide reductase [Alphaproteobacteria bacterium]|nr:thioredoxin-disulfide reductase [Alphaproteobacteria bacterium]
MNTHHSDILILGTGPAGYTASIYAARANRNTTIISGTQPGGQLSITTDVENYPGFANTIQGPWLMEQMQQQAANVGVQIISDHINSVNLQSDNTRSCTGDSGTQYHAKSLIIATGAQAKWLGLPSETKFQGHGVSACATCDGFFFRNQEVAVIGGGNTAAEEALFLTNFASKVHLVHRRDTMRAEKILQNRLLQNEKITPHWNHTLAEIIGTDNPLGVTHVRLNSTVGGEGKTVAVSGVFIAIGHSPATRLFKNKIKMDPHGYIITKPDSTQTEIPGVFAAGDVTDAVFRQAVTAAGMGCMAALEAEKYLSRNE